MSHLFTPFALRGLTFKNRVFVSPMCQYSAQDGLPNEWHLVHLGSRAVGGAALVIVEATAVNPEGRISPYDTGIWSDRHVEAFQPITAFIKAQGSVPGIQIAHAGRKASTDAPWKGGAYVPPEKGGWQPVAPSPLPFGPGDPVPREMTREDLDRVVHDFRAGARRALAAGFEVAEIHMAHGYLLHEFLSPLTNQRQDDFGGPFENRIRLPLLVAEAVREVWPADRPIFVRISATDWVEGGWDLAQSVALSEYLKAVGVDLIDCSSGGAVPDAKIPVGPGYQVQFAATIRKEARIPTGTVGKILAPEQAEQIVAMGQADAVLLARAELDDPYWPLHAAQKLRADMPWPVQYGRVRG